MAQTQNRFDKIHKKLSGARRPATQECTHRPHTLLTGSTPTCKLKKPQQIHNPTNICYFESEVLLARDILLRSSKKRISVFQFVSTRSAWPSKKETPTLFLPFPKDGSSQNRSSKGWKSRSSLSEILLAPHIYVWVFYRVQDSLRAYLRCSSLFHRCSFIVPSLFLRCSFSLLFLHYSLFLNCSFVFPSMFLCCSFNVPPLFSCFSWLFLYCSFVVPSLFHRCSFIVPSLFLRCSFSFVVPLLFLVP